jgi:aminoglycoside phosphotransferase (APT) family kinase protein
MSDGGVFLLPDSAPAGIDPSAVNDWLIRYVPGLVGPVQFKLIAGGRSNLTYLVTDAVEQRFALRRPPTGGVLNTAHDMAREWRFLSALADTDVPVPNPLAFCADPEVTGGEFYVMGYIEGLVLADAQAGLTLDPTSRARVGDEVIDVLVALQNIDPHEVGLGDIVRPGSYLERQLRRWHRQAHGSGASYLALLDEVHDLLAAGMPSETTGIVHGDFRPGNLSFDDAGRVLAIFDWELATVGDPMADLGWLMATWQEPDDSLPEVTTGPSTAPGFVSRAELQKRYERNSGRDVAELPYWIAFSRWRSACIAVGVAARYEAGVMADDGYAREALLQSRQAEQLVVAARDALGTL